MAEAYEADKTVSLHELTLEKAIEIVHSRSKMRNGTACWPCRQRKVKCDKNQPCDNCAKRNQHQLCYFKPNRFSSIPKTSSQASQTNRRIFLESDEGGKSRKYEQSGAFPSIVDIGVPTGIGVTEPEGNRYLGQNKSSVLSQEQSSPIGKIENVNFQRSMEYTRRHISEPYPLMSSHHLHQITEDFSRDAPSNREILRLFYTYKEMPHQFWGFVSDIDGFESKLLVYLEDRSRNSLNPLISNPLVNPSWLAILYAILAIGSQYHQSPYHIRTRDAQRYNHVAFHFLRLDNFLIRPSFESVQALLIISFVLLNDAKPEASWALLGLTCRIAQCLGLHCASIPGNTEDISEDTNENETARRKLWWTCVWQDTLTSLSFERCSITDFPSCEIPYGAQKQNGEYTYLEMMYHLMAIVSRRLNISATINSSYAEIVNHCEAINILEQCALPHMRNKEHCKTLLHHLQFYAMRLHTSFVISVACRPALRRHSCLSLKQKQELTNRCKENLIETVRMFLAMHRLSVIPTRSWTLTYHGLSSALLLSILCESKADTEIRQLQGDLITTLSATADEEGSLPGPDAQASDMDIDSPGPLWPALTALKSIYEHGTVMGSIVTRDNIHIIKQSSSHSSLQMREKADDKSNYGQFVDIQAPIDSTGSNEFSMTGLCGRASLQDSSAISWSQPLPTDSEVDSPLGATVYDAEWIAPMELYDYIWGECTTPWNSGIGAVNSDFAPQSDPRQTQQPIYF